MSTIVYETYNYSSSLSELCQYINLCLRGRSVFKCFILSNPESEDFKLQSTGSFDNTYFILLLDTNHIL